jgi:hypothetical protein
VNYNGAGGLGYLADVERSIVWQAELTAISRYLMAPVAIVTPDNAEKVAG